MGIDRSRLIRLPEVWHLCGISRSLLYELITKGVPCANAGGRTCGGMAPS